MLNLIPKKPRPNKVNDALLESWGVGGKHSNSVIRVLKAVDLVGSTNDPTDKYIAFMSPTTGPTILGEKVREIYSQLFEASHEPYKLDDGELRRLFNMYSGGAEKTLRYQVQTFKVLCENATFDSSASAAQLVVPIAPRDTPNGAATAFGTCPTLHIDLHIHLPPNKTTRDYQAIIEDIAHYIYQRGVTSDGQ